MRSAVLMAGLVILASACSGKSRATAPVPTAPSSTREQPAPASAAKKAPARNANAKARGPRKLNGVPPGHYPKPGECRLWYSGKPPGQQPKPQSCASLRGRVPAGAFVLYGGNAWDADYDWVAEARRDRTAVPEVILDILRRKS